MLQYRDISMGGFRRARNPLRSVPGGSPLRIYQMPARWECNMRLGGPLLDLKKPESPEQWIAALQAEGYAAAYCPVEADAGSDVIRAYADAAAKADIAIAEVGAWSNPIHPKDDIREWAWGRCTTQLALADEIGARCCVNIMGSRDSSNNGPDPRNYTQETFDMVVEIIRKVIDEVKPKRTFYTLEMMSWAMPDCAEQYLELIKAIDRPQFAAHVDLANICNSPRKYYENAEVTRHTLKLLAPHIKSCHVKDVSMEKKHLVHIDECQPGLGTMDYVTFMQEMDKVNPDMTLMMEHLRSMEAYRAGAEYLRQKAKEAGVDLQHAEAGTPA
jgi:sugar phosphate isomerase/epimerase